MRRKRITGLNFGGALTVITILITLGLLLMFKSMDLFSGNGKVAGVADFKTVGSSELTNPEYYPVADSNFIAGLSGNNTATPEVTTTTEVSEDSAYTMSTLETTGLVATRTDSFETAYYGFTLTADTAAQLEGIAFQIVKPDNSLSMMYMVEVADDNYDRDGNPVTTGISNQYLFKDGIKAIHFYYEGVKSFTVNRYAFDNEAKSFAATDVNLETQGINEFKTKLLAAGGLNIIPRSEYGAPPENNFAPGWIPPYYAVNRIVVHHTATSVDMANPANTVRAIWQNHSYTRDWGDIGYNYLIDPFGNIYDGRSGMTGIRGNHAPPNEGSIGISLLGDYSAQVPTQAALDSLAKLVAYLSELNDIPITWRTNYDGISPTDGIYPHRGFNDYVKAHYDNWAELVTACPGDAFMGILPTVMANAQNIKNANTQLPSVVNQYKQTINKEDIMRSEGNTEVLVDANKLTAAMKEFLTRPSRRFTLIKEVDGMLLYRVPDNMAAEFFIELNITAAEAKPQPNYLYTIESWDNTSPTRAIPSDYSLTGHWNLEKIKAPEAWKELSGCVSDNSCTGNLEVIIAVLDTGVAYENYTYVVGSDQDRDYYQNPEFSNVNFVGGYDAYQDYYCYSYGCTTDEADKINHANDDHGHGSAVTSVIAANIGDASPNIMVGIANGVSLMPVKISIPNDGDTGSGQSNTFLMSIALDYARENGADIVNISFGGDEYDSYIEDAVNEAYNAGMVIVAASGNENSSVIYPAAFANVIAVGASNELDLRASYSNYGPELDLVAPVGGGIYLSSMACYATSNCFSTTVLDTFSSPSSPINNKGGTSFAAPQVAAAAGLIKSYDNTLSHSDIENILINSATDILTVGKDNYSGYGIINIFNSIFVSSDTDLPNITNISPTSGPTTGGTLVTVTGLNFQPNATIVISGILLSSQQINYINTNTIKFNTPANSAGSVTIKVTNPDGYFTERQDAFTYISPKTSFFTATLFRSGKWNWGVTNTKYTTSGDFDGDGIDEIAAMYDYGSEDMALIVFNSDGASMTTSTWFRSGRGNWSVPNTKYLVAGDYNGDGKDEIAALYDYGSEDMAVIIFSANNGTFTPSIWFRSGKWNWGVANIKYLTSGDVDGDGKDNLVVMYDYGQEDMSLIVFTPSGATFSTQSWFRSGKWNWGVPFTKFVTAGDFDGDGKDEISAFYDYGQEDMAVIVFKGNNNQFTNSTWFRSGKWNWGVANTKYVTVGDFDNNGKDDLTAMYDYGQEDMSMIVFSGNNNSFTNSTWFRSGKWNWGVPFTKHIGSGDYDGNGLDEVATFYDYGQEDMSVIVFK